MILKVVGGVVRRALDPDVELLQDPPGRQLSGSQLLVRPRPDPLGGAVVEEIVEAEVALQLQMSPVIERVPQAAGDGGGPGFELLERFGISGAETLRYAI